MITESILTCPNCDKKVLHTMYENVTPVSFCCESCSQLGKIKPGQCCIYCEFGDYPCMNAQIVGSACCAGE